MPSNRRNTRTESTNAPSAIDATPVTDLNLLAAQQRATDQSSGDRAAVTYRTPLSGKASTDDRRAAVLEALTAAGMVGDEFTPAQLPYSFGGVGSIPTPKVMWKGVDTDSPTVDVRAYNATFTARRLEVLGAFAQGLSYSEAAEATHLNIGTVKGHARHLYDLFRVSGKIEAVLQAVRYGIIDTDGHPIPRS